MTRVAAVDCGTNSIRLLVADVVGGDKNDLRREMRVVRLGEGVDRTGVLSAPALTRTREALQEYAGICTALRVDRIRMVATSATRDAGNSEEFTALVRELLDVAPEIASGEQEAGLSFRGATAGLASSAPYVVIDIGGGSTEVVVGTHDVERWRSMDIGCVRLTERHLHSDPPTPQEVAAAAADVTSALQGLEPPSPATAIGLAGSVTTVAALAHQLPSYDPARIHHSTVTAAQVGEVTSRLLALTSAQRAELPVMHPGRADVIGAGALILQTLMEQLGLGQLLVSESDILDGIALSPLSA